jgi:hypothetical protein
MHEELLLAIDELRLHPSHSAWFIPVTLDKVFFDSGHFNWRTADDPRHPVGRFVHGMGSRIDAILRAVDSATMRRRLVVQPNVSAAAIRNARVDRRQARGTLQLMQVHLLLLTTRHLRCLPIQLFQMSTKTSCLQP